MDKQTLDHFAGLPTPGMRVRIRWKEKDFAWHILSEEGDGVSNFHRTKQDAIDTAKEKGWIIYEIGKKK